MDNQFFLNAGIPFDASSTPPAWRSLDAALHFPPQSSSDYNNNNNHNNHHFFDSAITSLASSPVSASNSAISHDSFVLRELIGKLGGICNSTEISPLSSPPKAGSTSSIMETFNTHLGNPISVPPLSSNLPAIPGDPAFAERAARFSPFGSRSFNGRGTTQFPSELHRVSSSPSINIGNGNGNLSSKNPRKRKSAPKGKCRDILCSSSPAKVAENGDDSSAKRSKVNEEGNDEKTEEEDDEEDEIKKQSTSQKPPEAPKDYIHVRARRGQATDSHSLAERVRREKISERMKLLQDLVPGCNKVTGKALMLEEIINYVQSLQRQVEFLSMKVATINPRLDFNTDTLFQKDVSQPNCSMQQTHTTYPLDALAPTLYGGHQHPQNSIQQNGITGSGMGPPCPNPMDPINQNHDMQLPTIDGFNNGVPELQLCESDLHTIVQMGFAQNSNHVVQDNSFQSQSLQGSNQVPAMKSEF